MAKARSKKAPRTEDEKRLQRNEQARRRRAWNKRQKERKAREAAARKQAKEPGFMDSYVDRIKAAAPAGWEVEVMVDAAQYDRNSYSIERYHPDADDEYRRNESLKGARCVVMKSEHETLIWRITAVDVTSKHAWGLDNGAATVDGSTYYKGDGGWRTYDRRGIDSSFYTGSLTDPAEVIAEQRERIVKSLAVSKEMVSIPGFGWRIHKDALPKVKAKLAEGGSHSFTPHGMGVGKQVTTRRPRDRYGWQKAGAAMAEFFGVGALYIIDFDYD